jgi:hypothetical protein
MLFVASAAARPDDAARWDVVYGAAKDDVLRVTTLP